MIFEQDNNYQIWKIKLQLAQERDSQAIEDIKNSCLIHRSQFTSIEKNLHDILQKAQIKYFRQSSTYGNYQIFNQVPIFLLLQGEIQLKCLNLEGDEENLFQISEKGVAYVSKDLISSKFGESNTNIITKFHLLFLKNSIVIEISEESRRKIQLNDKELPSLVGLREELIMKKYMLFPLKYIRIEDIDGKSPLCEQKFYLLSGHACYYLQKGKQRNILTIYEEGYINPKQFSNTQIKWYLFQKSKILIFEDQFMRDDVIAAIQFKRNQHIQNLIKSYEKLSIQEKKKIQLKLNNLHGLNKKQVDKLINGITDSIAKNKDQAFFKKNLTKNDLISTSSSIKQKCKIRISKKKKIN